jgi:hypothetical protein
LIAGAYAETISELVRRQPLVKLRRRWILLLSQKTLELALLGRRLLKHYSYVMNLHARIDGAPVKLRLSQSMEIPRNDASISRLHGARDAVWGGRR